MFIVSFLLLQVIRGPIDLITLQIDFSSFRKVMQNVRWCISMNSMQSKFGLLFLPFFFSFTLVSNECKFKFLFIITMWSIKWSGACALFLSRRTLLELFHRLVIVSNKIYCLSDIFTTLSNVHVQNTGRSFISEYCSIYFILFIPVFWFLATYFIIYSV